MESEQRYQRVCYTAWPDSNSNSNKNPSREKSRPKTARCAPRGMQGPRKDPRFFWPDITCGSGLAETLFKSQNNAGYAKVGSRIPVKVQRCVCNANAVDGYKRGLAGIGSICRCSFICYSKLLIRGPSAASSKLFVGNRVAELKTKS